MHNFEVLKHDASLRKANSLQLMGKWTLEMEYHCSLDRTIPIWRDSCRVPLLPDSSWCTEAASFVIICLTVHWEFLVIPPVPGKRGCNISKQQSGQVVRKDASQSHLWTHRNFGTFPKGILYTFWY